MRHRADDRTSGVPNRDAIVAAVVGLGGGNEQRGAGGAECGWARTESQEMESAGEGVVSDVGMAGPFYSVIGVVKEDVIRRFLTSIPSSFESASQDARLNGVFVEVDSQTGKAKRIERIHRT